MPAVRFSRDKRGYEYTYLVHTPTRRGKSGRTRVLYWYRTPPGVRIGRQAFDPDVQKLIEQQNPGVTFDWESIVNTPIPPPDMTEYWRERRRLEKAARQERRAMEADDAASEGGAEEGPVEAAPAEPDADRAVAPPQIAVVAAAEGQSEGAVPNAEGAPVEAGVATKKRRRRRGGRRRKPEGGVAAAGADPVGDASTDDDGGDQSEPDDPSSEGE